MTGGGRRHPGRVGGRTEGAMEMQTEERGEKINERKQDGGIKAWKSLDQDWRRIEQRVKDGLEEKE